MLNFIAIYLQLYNIFKVTRVSFFGTHYTSPKQQTAIEALFLIALCVCYMVFVCNFVNLFVILFVTIFL